jgi:hypothetical protein
MWMFLYKNIRDSIIIKHVYECFIRIWEKKNQIYKNK